MTQISAALESKIAGILSAHRVTLRSGANATLAEMTLTTDDHDVGGWVLDETCMRLAWVACIEHVRGLKLPQMMRFVDTRLSQFTGGDGDHLTAEASVSFQDDKGLRMRVALYRYPHGQDIGQRYLIAEYVSTGVTVSAKAEQTAIAEPEQAAANESEPKALTSRERTMEAKRRQIFDGACEVIGREGYAATTMRKVAKAAGLPLSSIYQYIDTKEDLLFMITSTCMEEIFDYMHAELLSEGSPEEKMQHAVEAYVKYISKNRRYINLVYRETRALSRQNREKVFDHERRFTLLWEKIINDGNKQGAFDAQKSRLAAHLIYFVCNLWSLRYWAVQDYTEEEVRDYLQRFVLSGLKAAEQ
jgi:AcrR family transcriptional regulator